MAKTYKLSFEGDQIVSLYDDALTPALAKAFSDDKPVVARASHIEADPSAQSIGFLVDLSPVGGGVLTGFSTRSQAISAEIDYLHKNFL